MQTVCSVRATRVQFATPPGGEQGLFHVWYKGHYLPLVHAQRLPGGYAGDWYTELPRDSNTRIFWNTSEVLPYTTPVLK